MPKKQSHTNSKYLELSVDPLQKQREQDIKSVEGVLKSHELLGNIMTKYWAEFKNFVRVEDHHTLTLFLKHESVSRKIYILLEGNVSAYILTDKTPKPIQVYQFEKGSVLTEIGALFGGRRHYGFMANTDIKLISLDLEYIEDEVAHNQAYADLIDVLYPETGQITSEICNIALERKLDLKDMLRKYYFFAHIESLADEELNKLAEQMKYVFIESNQVLADEANLDHIYLIESGTVSQTKVYKDLRTSDKVITIEEEVHRYDVVGEDNLDSISNTIVTAVTKTSCCLLQINVNSLTRKHSVITQIFGFFNNKINNILHKLTSKHQIDVRLKQRYFALANFSFMFMFILSSISILGRFQRYFSWSEETLLLHHVGFVTLVCLCLVRLIQPLNFSLQDLGLTTRNLKSGMIQAFSGGIVIIILATLMKDIYVKFYGYQFGVEVFEPELSINANLTFTGYGIFIFLYIVYIFIYELCSRGILQNIFALMFAHSRWHYWGSIIAASAIASQFHMSLFNEFSTVLFLANIFAGIIFANTKNLWSVFVFHIIFSLYILLVLGLLPNNHF